MSFSPKKQPRTRVKAITPEYRSDWVGAMVFAAFLLALLLLSPRAGATIRLEIKKPDNARISLRTSGIYSEVFEMAMQAYRDNDFQTAVRLWQPIAESGYAAAQYNLGVAHARGLSVPKNMNLAGLWWQAAANQGNVDAQYNLGLLYATGNGVKMDMKKAVHWWQQAASIGDPAAQFNLGMMYARGDGVSRNMDAAFHWWSQSAAQKFPQAQHVLEKFTNRQF